MFDVYTEWVGVLPEQFKTVSGSDKPNLSALLSTFSEQLAELHEVFMQLETDRIIENAVGYQLDMLGNLIDLSRMEAGQISGSAYGTADDDMYKPLLKYKALKNSTSGSIEDVFSAVRMLFNPISVEYKELEDSPAAFTVNITAKITDAIRGFMNTPGLMVKPAGVKATVNCIPTEFFGFKNLNAKALGFGVGTLSFSSVTASEVHNG